MKILVFGNPLVKKDSLALKLMPKLQKQFPQIEFKEFDSIEDLHKQGDVKILDVAEGIEEVKILNSLESLNVPKSYSLHDFDLAFNLKLLKKIDMIDTVDIIAVPHNMKQGEALTEVEKILKKFIS